MAKVFMYAWILAGLDALFIMAGLSTGTGQLLAALGLANLNASVYQSAAWYANTAFLISAAASVAAIVIGYYTRSSTESNLVATYIAPLLMGWIFGDFVSLMTYAFAAGGIVKFMSILILVPLMAGFLISIIQWWRGNDI
jgi:hypothetical protein